MSTYNPSSDADVDRRYLEALDEAEAVLARYLDPATMTPVHLVSLDSMARERAQHHPALDHTSAHDVELVFGTIQAVLKERCVADLTSIDRVFLDLAGFHGDRAWAAEIPAIAFGALTSQDSLFRPGRQEAIAVWFDPVLAGFVTLTSRAGHAYSKPNIYRAAGYQAIVGSFPSTEAAFEAASDLRRAVTTIATTALALEDEDDEAAAGPEVKHVDLNVL